MQSMLMPVYLLFLFTVTSAFPVWQNEYEDGSLFVRSGVQKTHKKQLLLHGAATHNDMPPHSEGVFDSFGHHLTGNSPIQYVKVAQKG